MAVVTLRMEIGTMTKKYQAVVLLGVEVLVLSYVAKVTRFT